MVSRRECHSPGMRAGTGNAVALMAAPMNRTKPENGRLSSAILGKGESASSAPDANGTMMLV